MPNPKPTTINPKDSRYERGNFRGAGQERSNATLKNSLYDSYIRAIRWASDRIGDAGVVAYVSNAGWLDANTADGLRQCLVEEFASIHIFHLRGNARTSGERRRKEKDNVFGQGTRTPVAVTVLVKNPSTTDHVRIRFHDIGDYLTREEKLAKIAGLGSISGIERAKGWQTITPDEYGDWLNQRDSSFDVFIAMGAKGAGTSALFRSYSGGVKTNRDAWAYNPSREALATNMRAMVEFYHQEADRFECAHVGLGRRERDSLVDNFIDTDPKKISWDHAQKVGVSSGRKVPYKDGALRIASYRPFTLQWLYFDRFYNNRVYQLPRIFPSTEATNKIICINENWQTGGMIAIMSSHLSDIHANGDAQCFPRYLYDEEEIEKDDGQQGDFLANGGSAASYRRRDAITDEGLAHFLARYPGATITKDDLFYYVYGLLHSEEYRARYADNLSKQLPRIPAVKQATDFWTFVEAGRKLGNLHCNYEQVEPYPVVFARGDTSLAPPADPVSFYYVEQMRFAGKRPKLDKSTVIYNANITMTDIPLAAYEYVVNGKSALEWVIERQCVRKDKASGIVSDANRYAVETVGDPRYPLMLFQRVITVSLETMKIVKALPPLGHLA